RWLRRASVLGPETEPAFFPSSRGVQCPEDSHYLRCADLDMDGPVSKAAPAAGAVDSSAVARVGREDPSRRTQSSETGTRGGRFQLDEWIQDLSIGGHSDQKA